MSMMTLILSSTLSAQELKPLQHWRACKRKIIARQQHCSKALQRKAIREPRPILDGCMCLVRECHATINEQSSYSARRRRRVFQTQKIRSAGCTSMVGVSRKIILSPWAGIRRQQHVGSKRPRRISPPCNARDGHRSTKVHRRRGTLALPPERQPDAPWRFTGINPALRTSPLIPECEDEPLIV